MAISITEQFLNRDKREQEALTVTLPAVLDAGGGRTRALPSYAQLGEDYIARVVAASTIATKCYLVVEEAFPADTLATVLVGGVAVFTDAPVDALGMTVSTVEDISSMGGGEVSITLSGTGTEVTAGKLKVAMSVLSYNTLNGRYTVNPQV